MILLCAVVLLQRSTAHGGWYVEHVSTTAMTIRILTVGESCATFGARWAGAVPSAVSSEGQTPHLNCDVIEL